ncbi:GNAT family N-acetyltransferase [Streptomyces sp. NPDC048603]|uniref:GNAT family N-acetyltransferase n=1 Tax=Streptomyces sp. NPDC048603 TaxID=3365577 RepID=UPI003718FEF2
MRVRAARAEEAEALTALVRRSKAHWGYDEEQLASWEPALRIEGTEVGHRRIVVAEDPDGVRGVASLEGAGGAAEAVLGLLFVEPEAIGRGVGRVLYRYVLRRARQLGVRRLLVDADPHAAGFYRAMGAVPEAEPEPGTADGLIRFTVELPPPAGWVAAWTGGHRAVHLGNVAEFNAQFRDPSLDASQYAAHHYASLAALYTPHPAALVLPLPVPPGWLELLSRELAWDGVELYEGLADEAGPGLSGAVAARPALAGRLRALGLPLVPWGRTESFGRLSGRPLPAGALLHESKAASNGLFRQLAADGAHPGIVVPRQWPAPTRRAAARLLSERTRAGLATVLKSEHGVGGSGTTVVTAERVREEGGARAVLRGLPRGPLLAEEFVPVGTDAASRDLTYDGFVDADGTVHEVGAAVMHVVGTGYRGATVGPGVVPEPLLGPLLAFGRAVGAELAASGHRGWFDVDFVADDRGRLAPVETNLRLTGPSIAFMAAARLDEVRGGRHVVRILDRVELGARLPDAQLAPFLRSLSRGCADLGAVFLPAIATAAFARAPYLGVLIAARTAAAVDAAEEWVREEARGLGRMFETAGP